MIRRQRKGRKRSDTAMGVRLVEIRRERGKIHERPSTAATCHTRMRQERGLSRPAKGEKLEGLFIASSFDCPRPMGER